MSTATAVAELEPLKRLTKDLAKAAVTLSPHEARFLVDAYYTMQKNRIAADHQIRTLHEGSEPHAVLDWLSAQNEMLEAQIKRALDKWTDGHIVGQWAKSICGIGPVIAAGLLAHIDITRREMVNGVEVSCSESVGHIWSFAGLNPEMVWNKGEKRPFNASLKTLCAFKLGESFVKFQNNDNDVYGKVFVYRKKIEQDKNERLQFEPLAKQRLASVGKSTDAYKSYVEGKLPPAHIHARARRYAVKLFLAHYHMVTYFVQFQKLPPFPYAFSKLLDHIHFIAPPHADLIPGLIPALREYEADLRKRPNVQPRPAGAPKVVSEPSRQRAPREKREPKMNASAKRDV